MFAQLKKHFIEYIVVAIILTGVLYSATTSYKTSVKVDNIVGSIKSNEKKIKVISASIAIKELKNGTLSEEDIKALMTESEFNKLKLRINAMDK